MRINKSYSSFLKSKQVTLASSGIEPSEPNVILFPFQRDIVKWALRRGRACVFADCGLGKTPMQLTWAQNVVETTCKPVLVLTPLAVGAQTVRAYCTSLPLHQSSLRVVQWRLRVVQ